MSFCQECLGNIEADQAFVQCPQCGASYHQACWDKNGGCTVAGCGYRANAAQPVQEAPAPAPAAPAAPVNQYVCQQCGTVLQENQYVCPTCGVARRRGVAPAPAAPVAPQYVPQQPQYAAPVAPVPTACPNCGAPLAAGQQFCGKCGFSVPQQPQYAAPAAPQQQIPTAAKVMSIIGMCLGIASIVFCWATICGLLFGIPGLILSIMGKKKARNGMATAGLICSIIGMAIGLVFSIIWIAACGTAVSYSSYYW